MTTLNHLGSSRSSAHEIDSQYLDTARNAGRAERLAPLRSAGLRPSSAPTTTWVGDLQQGDGGKGAMTDRLASRHQVVVRVQGGDNAGHTTVFRNAGRKTSFSRTTSSPPGCVIQESSESSRTGS